MIRIVTSPEYDVVYITGRQHMARKGSHDVQGLHGNIGKVQKFPKGLESNFPNLISIHFTNGQIKELVAEDLKPFPELVEIILERNNIEVVEEGTFDYNPKLVGISFFHNKLFHINANVFDHLTALTDLWLQGNPCVSSVVRNNRNSVLNLVATVKNTCQNPAILRLERKTKGACPTSSTTQIPITTEKIRETTTSSNKCKNINEIFEGYSKKIVDMKAQCENPESEDVKRKIEEFEIEYENMHSMFTFTLDNKFEDLKNHLNC